MVKIAVLGKGPARKEHLKTWSAISGVEVVGEKENLSLQEALSLDVDVVDLCLPLDQRADYIRRASKKGLHIICEAPIAQSVEEAESIVKACSQNQTNLYLGNSHRFHPAYVNAREQLEDGSLGNPGVLRITHSIPRPEKEADLFLQVGNADFDWLVWALGDVERVTAKRVQKKRQDGSLLEFALVTLRMENQAIAHVELSWSTEKVEQTFELTGEYGMLTYNGKESNPIQVELTSGNLDVEEGLFVKNPLRREMEAIINSLNSEGSVPFTPVDAMKAMKIAEAAKHSVAIGEPVSLKRGALL
ncbi:Gfo/Idh/MocA family protein [Oceanobacillus bengalensis]|uniref:Gfo/Idh/MocA family protein n=1 Tax=Oceanobacillus bengalensis TaxID=1435466 RepID=UPI0015FF2068|nr:Gfo/Idh/MocA family oxidoreductase [Oceanobacillus bengalensis]